MRAPHSLTLTPTPLPQGEGFENPSPCGRGDGVRAGFRLVPSYMIFSAPPRLRGVLSVRSGQHRGFTLIELLLVLTLVALLASLVAPVVTNTIQHARESALKEDLFTLRKAIDDYYADTGAYPADLEVLAQKRYLRKIPADPMTDRRDTWVLVHAEDAKGKDGGVIDVHSGSEEKGGDGVPYKEW